MRVVFSGGPGAGKTTTLERLRERGHVVVPESARQLIAERKARGLSPRPAPRDFAEAILERDIERYEVSAGPGEPVFFDRCLLDSLGMLWSLGVLSEQRRDAYLAQYPYHGTAFIFPPWEAIYRQDSERDQSFEEALRVHASIRRWYSLCGYTLAEVPPATPDERCDRIVEMLTET